MKSQETDTVDAVAAAEVDLSVLQQTVGFHVHMFDVTQYQKFYERFGERAFTPAIISTMAVIRQNPGIRHGALSDALMIQRPNMTSLLNELEREGYVSRRPSQTDKRSVAIYLTDRGERAVARMLESILTLDRAMTAGLTAPERKALLALLQKALGTSR
ncbi:MAG TPA: MarR family transcriptional regulator [Alphaproteobacteria bacterium]|nr:MarR family transcriptional regulator [Alphaproteobacteria bacterium]